jgi:predicted nucleic acid-binding protein
VAERLLLDTGFIVALLNPADPDHEACVAASRSVRGHVFSVEGTLVEAAHLLRNEPETVARAVALLRQAEARIATPSAARTDRAMALMKKYRDVPMDYVDADLVALAEEEGIETALTLDVRGFSAFRLQGGQAFTIVPNPSALRGRRRR